MGDASLLTQGVRISIIGAREASTEGIRRARVLARELAVQGVVVVSGLARGIDRTAHVAAIEAGGRTIAVIGTPLDEAYPSENAGLQRQIAAEHLVVSQFSEGTVTTRRHFPMRNQTMALLTDATVIVEAGESSGSRYQGWEALRLGRPLFLLESLVRNDNVSWPKAMIEHGARVLCREGLPALIECVRAQGTAFANHSTDEELSMTELQQLKREAQVRDHLRARTMDVSDGRMLLLRPEWLRGAKVKWSNASLV